jgi:hypothetical protein
MTVRIKRNGYSITNDSSAIWAFDNNGNDLMTFVMDKVFKTIAGTIKSSPKQIVINGIIDSTYDTSSHSFNFNELFPLTGAVTPFNYEITYTIFKDTVDSAGNIITIEREEISNVQFNVIVQEGAPNLADTFDVRYWKRGLGFYYGGTEIFAANEQMDSIEVRLVYNPGDAGYNYTNVQVEIKNAKGNPRDIDTLNLAKINDSTFTFKFKREIDSLFPKPDDVLQHYSVDSIIATFRNTESTLMPLDSFRISIPFDVGIQIQSIGLRDKELKLYCKKVAQEKYSIYVNNLPCTGEMHIYTLNGKEIYQHFLQKGNTYLALSKPLSSAIYLMRITYGEHVLMKKFLLQ